MQVSGFDAVQVSGFAVQVSGFDAVQVSGFAVQVSVGLLLYR